MLYHEKIILFRFLLKSSHHFLLFTRILFSKIFPHTCSSSPWFHFNIDWPLLCHFIRSQIRASVQSKFNGCLLVLTILDPWASVYIAAHPLSFTRSFWCSPSLHYCFLISLASYTIEPGRDFGLYLVLLIPSWYLEIKNYVLCDNSYFTYLVLVSPNSSYKHLSYLTSSCTEKNVTNIKNTWFFFCCHLSFTHINERQLLSFTYWTWKKEATQCSTCYSHLSPIPRKSYCLHCYHPNLITYITSHLGYYKQPLKCSSFSQYFLQYSLFTKSVFPPSFQVSVDHSTPLPVFY